VEALEDLIEDLTGEGWAEQMVVGELDREFYDRAD